MAKKKSIETEESIESTEAVASEPTQKSGAWKAVTNLIVGKGVEVKSGSEVPSELVTEELISLGLVSKD